MDIRNILNGYFEKTPVPKELDPHNVSSFVVPNVTEKKEAPIEEPEQTDVQAQKQAPRQIQKQAAEQTRQIQPRGVQVPQTVPMVKPQPMPQARVPEQNENSPRSGNYNGRGYADESESVNENENEQEVINASAFIKIVRHHRLTGMEFLSILGNSKISNKAYQEIKSNPGLTVKRLIELLEESPLTSSDYERLIIAVQRMSELKAEAKAKIKSEPNRVPPRTEAAEEAAASVSAKSPAPPEAGDKPSPKASEKAPLSLGEKRPEGYTPNAARYYYDPNEDDDNDDDNDDDDKNGSRSKDGGDSSGNGSRENEASDSSEDQLASVKSRIQINFDDDDDEDEDEDDDYDDYDGEGRKRRGSNKGKIAVSAVGAAALIGLSFGLRYHMTGSWLPYEEAIVEEKELDESGIFAMLNSLPSPSPAFTSNTLYSAGGIKEESVFKNPVSGNKRLLYSENNKLYIYEQIGGQIAKLETRDYKDRTFVGLIEAGDKLAAVSTGISEPYSFTYTVPASAEDEPDMMATGTIQRQETYVEITDHSSPEKVTEGNRITLSGTVVTAYVLEDRLVIVTYEELEGDSVGTDRTTFMPYISVGGNKSFCEAEKVFVPADPTHKGIVAVFSADLNDIGSFDIAAAAGGKAPLVTKCGSELYIGQNSTLIRYDLSSGVTENGHCGIAGEISDFSGINAVNGAIRVTASEKNTDTGEYSATLTVLDNELMPVTEIKNIGKGETLLCTCFYESETYIVTENGTCFGIDGDNGVMSQSSVKITNENIYKYSDEIGIKITAADNGASRTGIIVSTVMLDGKLTPLYSLEISSKTVAVNALDEYLSSPAEEDIYTLGGSGENGFLVIPVEYFDGVCQVERFVICSVGSDGILSVNGAITEYDRRSDRIFAQVDGDVVIAVTKGKIITAKAQDGSVQAYFLT